MTHAPSLTLTLSPKEREQRSPRAESPSVSPFAHRGLRLSLPQRGRAGVREKSLDTKVVIPGILAEVEWQLCVVEEFGSVVPANLQRATRLRQSVLQKAFTGKLL